jgi:methylmalonyl-CoA mutase
MSLNDIINYSFSSQTYEDWINKAEESLKGKSLDTLKTNTYEDIKLKPLYTKKDIQQMDQHSFPGMGDRKRASNFGGYISKPWKIAQQIDTEETHEFINRLTTSFEKGQTAIAFKLSVNILKNINTILEDVYDRYPFCVNGAYEYNELLEAIIQFPKKEQVTGYIANDPVALHAKERAEKKDITVAYDRLFTTMQKVASACPHLKTLLVDTSPYHNAGANAFQELAIALATTVYHIEQLKQHGMSEVDIVSKLVFHFSVGQNFFMEVAKLRAARVLIAQLFEAYGISEQEVEFSAETSKYTKTAYDPYVNLLRSGNEAFAAVLGGVQYLHVSPYNEPAGPATEFSDRIARNIQLILKEEARLSKVIDPAGGSWYIESLTEELMNKAWSLFIDIDDRGGMIEVWDNNWLQNQIAEIRNKREADIFSRKQSIIGVNKYALLKDTPLPVPDHKSKSNQINVVDPLSKTRLSYPFEILRAKSEKLAQNGNPPSIGLLCLGKLKNHKLRADFITDFLTPGGITAKRSGELRTIEEALAYIDHTNYQHYVVCGSDQEYMQWNLPLLKELNESYPNVKLYVAGLPSLEEQKELTQNGLSGFIHIKSNCYQMLVDFLNEMEVE